MATAPRAPGTRTGLDLIGRTRVLERLAGALDGSLAPRKLARLVGLRGLGHMLLARARAA